MAEFLRPEVRALARRWQEVIFAGLVLVVGLWWAFTGVGINRWLGYIFCVVGIGWGIAAIQRVRFHQDGDGPGVVQVRERRLAYFGPLDGGVMDVDDLQRLELDPTSTPDPSWVLTGDVGQRIAIPINAAGTDALFDVFAALPGIDTTNLLHVLSHPPDARVTIWERQRPLLH